MRESKPVLVTNTTPLIALTSATGGLGILQFLYSRVVVPLEVAREVRMGGKQSFGLDVFNDADWLDVQTNEVELPPFLRNSLDRGEASVVQTALNLGVPLVCIDETAGRRIARLVLWRSPAPSAFCSKPGVWVSTYQFRLRCNVCKRRVFG